MDTESNYDLFISYAHADDEVPQGAASGWVTTLVEELKKQLRRMLGGSGASIWMDHQLAENQRVDETLLDTVSRSRVLVLFMSRGYSRSEWCQKELGNFLALNQSTKHKESVFIVELHPTHRESWHPRLQELTPLRFWRKGPDEIPELLGMPVPKLDPDDPYWRNLNRLAYLIFENLDISRNTPAPATPAPPPKPTDKTPIWIAEPTDDLIDQWESLAGAIRQAGADLRPLGLDTYPRASEAEFLASLRGDLAGATLFVQLLSGAQGRKPKDGPLSFTALQAALAAETAQENRLGFLKWRSPDVKLDGVADDSYRQVLTGAISCGFEEFRQQVLTALEKLNQPARPAPATEDSLAILINAYKTDRDLGRRICDILVDLGEDAVLAQSEPTPDQSPTDFNAQLDETLLDSGGLIIVYGQTPPAWAQAQFMRARKVLAQHRKGIWGALLDGPPREKQDHGVMGKNLMVLDCRDGLERRHIEQFVNALRGAGHA